MGGDWKEMLRGVEINDFNLVRYYISMGIDLNYQHPEFLTSALIESINRNHLEMMAFLLENGAMPDLKEVWSNKTPMNIAKELKNKEAVNILNQYLNTNETIEENSSTSMLKNIYSFISNRF